MAIDGSLRGKMSRSPVAPKLYCVQSHGKKKTTTSIPFRSTLTESISSTAVGS